MGARNSSPRTRSPGAGVARSAGSSSDSWQRLVRSPSFREGLEDVVRKELSAARSMAVRDLIDAEAVRAVIGASGPAIARPKVTAEVIVGVNRRVEKRLRGQRRSVHEILSPEIRDEIEALLDEELPSPEALEEILAQVLRQRFVRKLLAELIHSAIISFNKRVNPFFGGITAAVLEDQIKAFIELGMPMLQEQAVSFALHPSNQRFAVDLARSLLRGIMDEPIGDLVPPSSDAQRRRIERLVARVLESEQFCEAAPAMAQSMWDDIYAQIRNLKLAKLVDVDLLADSLAAPIAEMMIAGLSRPRIADFLEKQLRE